jgi:hypothetical protein
MEKCIDCKITKTDEKIIGKSYTGMPLVRCAAMGGVKIGLGADSCNEANLPQEYIKRIEEAKQNDGKLGTIKRDPIRMRRFKETITVAKAERTIEKNFGLPKGSIMLINPDKTDARGDKFIGSLRKAHDKSLDDMKKGVLRYNQVYPYHSVGAVIRSIEEVYGLKGMVLILRPNKKLAYKNKLMRSLLAEYGM